MAKGKKFDAAGFATRYAKELEALGAEMLRNFDGSSQGMINRAFANMGETRFVGKNDRWEQVMAHQAGREYEAPPARLIARWRMA